MAKKSMFRRHPVLGTGIAIVFLLMAGLVGVVFFFPENLVRSTLGAQASSKIGRDMTIDGPFTIDWDWTTPRVHAENVRIANMDGSPDKDMVTVGAVDFSIKMWKLLIGRVVIPDLKVEAPRIVLEKNAAGQKNWDFPALSKANAVTGAVLPDDRHSFPILDQIMFSSGTLIYRDGVKKLDVELKLEAAKGGEGNKRFQITGEGTLQDQAFTLNATGGSLTMLRDSSKAFPLDFDMTMGPTKVSVRGTFTDPVTIKGMDATLELSGHNLADLFYLTGIPLPPSPPYTLTGQLKKDKDVWGFSGFKGTVGGSDLSGDLSYDTGGDRGLMKANLFSSKMDIDDLGGLIGLKPKAEKAADAQQKQDAAEQKASPTLLPDVPIDLDRLRSADMDVTLKVLKIHAPGWPFEDMDTRFDLRDGVLKVDPLKFNMADGAVDGSLTLDGRENVPDVKADLDVKKLSLSRFFAGTRFEALSKGHFGGHIDLAGQGKSLADVLGGSEGRVVMVMSGGTISLLLIRAANIDLQNAPPLFIGKDEATEIRCAVADFKVSDGLLTSQIFNVDTTASNIELPTAINLKTETIDAKLISHAKDPSLMAGQIPVVITGPLKNPSIGLDPVEAGTRGAAAAVLGAVLTPLASIIPFIEPGLGEDSNCKDLIAMARVDANKPAKTD